MENQISTYKILRKYKTHLWVLMQRHFGDKSDGMDMRSSELKALKTKFCGSIPDNKDLGKSPLKLFWVFPGALKKQVCENKHIFLLSPAETEKYTRPKTWRASFHSTARKAIQTLK